MYTRRQPLPGDLATASIPMTVHRGRSRAPRQPDRPAHVWAFDSAGEAALSAWTTRLADAARETGSR